MQEHRRNEADILTEKATLEDFREALAKKENEAVTMHRPGSEFSANGKRFRVGDDATITQRRRARKKNKAARNARRKNR